MAAGGQEHLDCCRQRIARRTGLAPLVLSLLLVAGCAGRRATGPGAEPPGAGPRMPIHPGRPLRVAIQVEAERLEISAESPARLARPGEAAIGRFRRLSLAALSSGAIAIEPANSERRVLADTLRIQPAAKRTKS